MKYIYPCVLHPEEEGGFYVVFPDVRGALTGGDDRKEALEMAEDALAVALAGYVYQGRDLPVPSPAADGQELVAVPPITAAKFALYTAMREQGISTRDLGERLGLDEIATAKLIDPDRYTHITQVMKALKAVGRNIVIEDRKISTPQLQQAHPVVA